MLKRVTNLSMKQMRAVQAVARSSSFLAASAELQMSQPGISRLVQATEDELGVPLFHRSTRQVILTPEGLAFLPAIDRILAEFDLSVASLSAMHARQAGHVVVACPVSVANHLLAEIISEFRRKHPHVTLEVREALRSQVVHQVRYGSVDLGIASFMDADDDLVIEDLGDVTYHVIFHRDHQFRGKEAVRIAELRDVPMISLPPSSVLRRIFDGAAARKGIQLNHVITVNTSGTVFDLVRMGEGVAIQSSWSIVSHPRDELEARPLVAPTITSKASIIRKKSRPLTPAAAAFQLALKEYFIKRTPDRHFTSGKNGAAFSSKPSA